MEDITLIDIRSCPLTTKEVMEKIKNEFRPLYPSSEYEIFMDGDAYAIVARKK